MSFLDELKNRIAAGAKAGVQAYLNTDEAKQKVASSDYKGSATSVKSTLRDAFEPAVSLYEKYRSNREEKNWYSGDKPTQRETLARIYQLGMKDESKREGLMQAYEQEIADPSSPIYGPYAQATTSRSNKTTLANTQKALAEWDELTRELTYWAGRDDLNLSDDDIIARVDWSQYQTLKKMDAGREAGSPLDLLEPVGYSDDAMRGVMWAARNPGKGTGDAMMDAVQSVLGRGTAYVRDGVKAEQLNPASQSYNPYAVSGTMTGLERKYGTTGFDSGWLEQNIGMRGDSDYAKIYNAEQFTAEAEAELEDFNRRLQEELTANPAQDADELIDYLFDSERYKALARMEESLKSGKLLDTTRAINYDRRQIEQSIREQTKQAQLREAALTDPAAMNEVVEQEKRAAAEANGGSLLTPGMIADNAPEVIQKSVLYDGNVNPAVFQEGIAWVGNRLRDRRKQKLDEKAAEKEERSEKLENATLAIAGAGMSDVAPSDAEMAPADTPEDATEAEQAKKEAAPVRIPTAEEVQEMQATVEALEAEGRYREAAEIQFPLILAAVTNSEDEYVKELVTSVGSQEAAMYLTKLVLEGDMLNEVDDLDVWDAVANYEFYICKALDIEPSSADMFAQVMDFMTGGALSDTRDNEGVGLIRSVGSAAKQGLAKTNDLWANIAGMVMTGYGHAVKGTDWLVNNTLGRVFGVESNAGEKVVEAGRNVAGYYDQISAKEEAFMRENASPLEYFSATAGSEAIKMGVQSIIGAGLAGKSGGSVSQLMNRGGNRQLQTALDLAKAEGLARQMAAASPFVADSVASEFNAAYEETESPVSAMISSLVSGFATMSLMNLDAIKNIERMGSFVPEVIETLKAVPGAGMMATAKRYGKAGMMYIGNMFKTAANEAIQEPTENFLKTWATDALKGKDFFDRDWAEYSSELAQDAFYAMIGTFGNTLACWPDWSRSAIYANQMMGRTGLTAEEVTGQLNAFAEDMNDPQVAAQLQANLNEAAVEVRAGELLAGGATPQLDDVKLEATRKAAEDAQARAEETGAALEAAAAAVDSANEQFMSNPADDGAKQQLTAAMTEEENARTANDQAVKDAQAAQEELATAQNSVQAQSDAVMGAVREQARAEVEAAVSEVSAYREAQEIERQTEKADAMFGYSDEARAESLAGKTISVTDISQRESQLSATDIAHLEQSTKKDAVKYVKTLVGKFGIFKRYANGQADIDFEFTKRGFAESVNKQANRTGDMGAFAKMLANMDPIIENAVPVETHKDKYVGSKREDASLERVYVLLSAFRDGSGIIPVQLEVKEFTNKDNKLYAVVTLKKTEAADLSADPSVNTDVNNATAASEISIPDLVGKINPDDGEFLKYIPDSMLSSEQQASKENALEKERRKIEGLKEKKEEPNVSRTQIPPQVVRPGNSPTGKLVNPVESAKKLAKTLGVGERIGTRKMNNMPQAVLGYYHNRARYLAVRPTQASNITVAFHEIGHALSQRLGLTGTAGMIANLNPAFAQNYPANELPGEAFAEFMWRYMVDDAQAEAFAGSGFMYQFEQELRRAGLAEAVHKARDEMHAYVNATVLERIRAMVKDRSYKPKTTIGEKLTQMLAGLVDSTKPLEAVDSFVRRQNNGGNTAGANLQNAALLRNVAAKRAWNQLTGGRTDANWTVVGDSLKSVLEATGVHGRDFDLLNAYMLAQHSLDRDAQGLPVFDQSITAAQRSQMIADVERDHPEVAAAAQAIHDWWHDFMQTMMVNTGFLTQEALDTFEQMYPHYVPTNRVKKQGVGRGAGGSKTYTVMRATGSTEEIYSPMDSLVQNVNRIVEMVSQNNVALTFDRLYQQYDGLGIFGREVTQDVERDHVDVRNLRDQIEEILTQANTDVDAMDEVLDLIGTEQEEWRGTGRVNLPNILTVQRADGRRVFYEITDNEMFKSLANTKDGGNQLLDFVGRLTRAMSALTTGGNPLFGIRNFARDFQKSVTYGSWASNYATGTAKWLRAAYDVWRNQGDYPQYKALGGGGWTRIDANTKKGATEYRGELFRGYNTSNVGRTAKWAGKKIWETVTLSRLNEVIEQTSRYAEYRYGKNDKSTPEGRQQAFLDSQEASVDFSRSGNSSAAYALKQIIPFFNASTQGVYQTVREYTSEKERGRLPVRFVKTVVNTMLASALSSAALLKFMDDDDKEEFFWLSDDLKSEHFYLPNFAPDVLGEAPLIRIPIAQDPLAMAVHNLMTNAIWSGQGDEPVIEASVIAGNLLSSFNPVSGTIFDAAIATATNRNWYGSRIVPQRMEQWDPTTQYTEETADVFVYAGRVLGMSPMMLEYLAEQYTGFLGQIVIPAISKDAQTGEMQGLPAAVAEARKKLTSDPLISNDVINAFYDGSELLTTVTKAAQNGKPANMLRRGLSYQEANRAAEEAKALNSSKGIIGQTKKLITEGYNRIDEIEADTTLNEHEKYQLTSEIRREMIEAALDANEAFGEYRERYIDGLSLLDRFIEGSYGRKAE